MKSPLSQISPLTMAMLNQLTTGTAEAAPLAKKTRNPKRLQAQFLDPNESLAKRDGEEQTLSKSLENFLSDSSEIHRLAFTRDPTIQNRYAGIYQVKARLLPDHLLKRLAIQDDLVATIVNTRAAHLQSFGRPRPDRFSHGFDIVPDIGLVDKMTEEERKEFEKRTDRAKKLLSTCGQSEGWADRNKLSFSQYMGMSARNAVTVGRIATEIIYVRKPNGEKAFHSFRPVDAGTIYPMLGLRTEAQSVRDEAFYLLSSSATTQDGSKLKRESFDNDEYAWVQVVHGTPVQVFTEDELVAHNFYQSVDIEVDGFPITPIDVSIAAITTHINITTHNKLYFQMGRAAKGMLVLKSEDADEDVVKRIKHQFQASINSVSNSWRMPVFSVGADEEIIWQPIDGGSKDMEFQYLSDTNARVIMSAFQISPEELPGYQHLSRGTNNQALSESNNEYKLEAARDVGIRPLVSQFEDFINTRILPLIDPMLASCCVVKFMGLDAETPEKEGTRLKNYQDLHYTYDEVLEEVDKVPVGVQYGGQIPFNPLYRQVLDAYFTVGEILERFCGKQGASQDPKLAYVRDPMWFQWQQMQMEQQQMQMQQQQMQAQAQQQQAQGGQPPPDDGDGGGQSAPDQGQPQQGGDLSTGIDQVLGMLTKSEAQLPASRRRLLERQRRTVDFAIKGMESDLKNLTSTILDVADGFTPKKG